MDMHHIEASALFPDLKQQLGGKVGMVFAEAIEIKDRYAVDHLKLTGSNGQFLIAVRSSGQYTNRCTCEGLPLA